MRKKIAIFLVVALILTLALSACDDKGKKIDFPEMKEYSLTEGAGEHVADVPYDEYLKKPVFTDDIYWVRAVDNGASPDKSAVENTALLQAAIDKASAEGNGKGAVEISGGVYYTGTLYMKSGVTLYIAEDSALKLPDYADYTSDEKSEFINGALIRAEGVDDWKITGPGKLDGNGADYTLESVNPTKNLPLETFDLKEKVLSYRERLRNRKNEKFGCHILYVNNCNDFSLSNIVIYEPSTWTIKIENSNNISVTDVVIDNNIYVANSDGIDICGSSNVEIKHCFIATGDDGIVLKSYCGVINNVLVEDCEIMSLANNFKIGTETGCDVSSVTVRDCYFFTAEIAGGNSGIAIESADGANISDVLVENIVMNNVPAALLVWLGCRLDEDKGSNGTVGSIDGVTVKNVYAKDVDIASAVVGCTYKDTVYPVRNVVLDNINIAYRECYERVEIYHGNDVLYANMNGYPEITRVSHMYFLSHETSQYYDMPVYGLYLYNVENVKATSFNVIERSANTRPYTNAGEFDKRDGIVNSSVGSDF